MAFTINSNGKTCRVFFQKKELGFYQETFYDDDDDDFVFVYFKFRVERKKVQ